MYIAVDFDGTCVEHRYPEVGPNVPHAVGVLKDLVAAGHDLILFTMRSGEPLQDAVDWFKDHGIPLYGVNTNPTQTEWTQSPKAYAHVYIDDAALGCPLILPPEGATRPYVDWPAVRTHLELGGALPRDTLVINSSGLDRLEAFVGDTAGLT